MDTTYLFEWANLLLRWAHVITAVAWIGASFYFVFLDSSLTRPTDQALKAKGVDGELWAVHGGGFYHPQKYMVAPAHLPEKLHWFYWESYWTWMTGFGLFVLMYLVQADTFLIDRQVLDWPVPAAVASALAFLLLFWVAYDIICRHFGRRTHGDLIVGVLVLVVVVAGTWLACQLFAGRAAFLIVGAMMATAMSANVARWIIPGQRAVIAQMKAGQPVDPIHGWRGKQRSVHNTYFTLPVLIAMLGTHYGWAFTHPHNWLVLLGLMLAGALIRHAFVARHRAHVEGRRAPWEWAVAGALLLMAMMWWMRPQVGPVALPVGPVNEAQVRHIMDQRCVMCHNAELASKNVALHTAQALNQHAQAVYQQTVVLRLMPMNNATGITEAERAILAQWFRQGTPRSSGVQ